MLLQKFNENIKERITLVFFTGKHCAPCQRMKKESHLYFKSVAEDLDIYKVIIIDVEDNPKIANQYIVRSLPTIIIFNNSIEIDRIIGYIDRRNIILRLDKIMGIEK